MVEKTNALPHEPYNHTVAAQVLARETGCNYPTPLKTADYTTLENLKEELIECIADYEVIIDMALDGSGSVESLRNDRLRWQQLVTELHMVKKMMKKLKKEKLVA